MSVYVKMTKEKIKKESDFVIYNYIASQKTVTEQQLKEDLRKKYGLKLNIKRNSENYIRLCEMRNLIT